MSNPVHTDAMAHGGDAIGRIDGKAIFIGGALPGETVEITDLDDRGSWGRASLAVVIDASPSRVDPPCPVFNACGGCQWQHAGYEAQLTYKTDVVLGQLRHLGRMDDPPVAETIAPGPAFAYRNRMSFYVERGRPGQRRAKSHAVVPTDACLLLLPQLSELFERLGDLTGVRKIVIRYGQRTGEMLVVLEGKIPTQANGWGCSVVQRSGARLRTVVGSSHLHEIVAGVRFRISGSAFFQVNTPGADELVALVSEAIQPGPEDILLDAYAGGGLFSATVGRAAGRVIAVESAADAVSDLRHNLAAQNVDQATVFEGPIEDLYADASEAWTLAICDPPRSGLGKVGVAGIVRPRPRAIAYISCDPASFARDVAILAESGYRLTRATPVDLFPQTYHIETVGLLVRQDQA